MGDTATTSPEVQEAIGGLLTTLEDSLKAADMATKEAERLRQDNARKDRIILEKVAAATSAPKVSPDLVAALVADLVDQDLAKKADADTLIKSLIEHPDNIVKLATKLTTISMPAPSQGTGIAKEASSKPHAPSANAEWDVVVENGA